MLELPDALPRPHGVPKRLLQIRAQLVVFGHREPAPLNTRLRRRLRRVLTAITIRTWCQVPIKAGSSVKTWWPSWTVSVSTVVEIMAELGLSGREPRASRP